MDLKTAFLTLQRSIMLLPHREVQWVVNDTPTVMDTKTFIVRSFAEQLLKDGVSKEDIKNVLDYFGAEKGEYPTGESYQVIFH